MKTRGLSIHNLSSSWPDITMATMGPRKGLDPINRQSIGIQQAITRGLLPFGQKSYSCFGGYH